jgi:hypothetical protein
MSSNNRKYAAPVLQLGLEVVKPISLSQVPHAKPQTAVVELSLAHNTPKVTRHLLFSQVISKKSMAQQ